LERDECSEVGVAAEDALDDRIAVGLTLSIDNPGAIDRASSDTRTRRRRN